MNIKGTMEDKMRRHNLLVTCAVVAFVAATGTSMAQQERGSQQERSAPAEKIAPQNTPGAHNQGPNGRTGEAPQNRSRETTGQAPREDRQSRPTERNSEPERGKTEQPSRSERNEQNRAAPQEQNRTTGQAPREERTNRSSEQNKSEQERGRTDRTEENRTNRSEQNTNRSSEQNKVEQERGRTEENRATTGQGAAGSRSNATVNLTPEKRTRIHEVIVKERNAPRVSSPDFNVSVGTRVPRTVRFATLPRTIVEIEPEWRGFEYFMVGEQIVVVNPNTMEIVAVLDA
jgi:hypothetical protein